LRRKNEQNISKMAITDNYVNDESVIYDPVIGTIIWKQLREEET